MHPSTGFELDSMSFIICLIFHPRTLLVEKWFFVESMEIDCYKNQ